MLTLLSYDVNMAVDKVSRRVPDKSSATADRTTPPEALTPHSESSFMLSKSRVRVQPQNIYEPSPIEDSLSCTNLDDEVAIARAELHQCLEDQVQEIAPDTSFASFDYIHIAFQDFAQKTADEINQAARIELEQQLKLGRKLLEAKKVLTRQKEYSRFIEVLNLTAAEARKRLKLAEIFGNWDIQRLLEISGATSLFVLCQSKYAEVVEQLRELPEITKDLVKRLVKEAQIAYAKQKPKAQQQQESDAVLEKHVDEETGTFYYTLKQVNLSYATGSALAALLETHTIGQVIAKAVEVRDDYVLSQQQELQSVVADVQRLTAENRQLKFQLEEWDCLIAELEVQCNDRDNWNPYLVLLRGLLL